MTAQLRGCLANEFKTSAPWYSKSVTPRTLIELHNAALISEFSGCVGHPVSSRGNCPQPRGARPDGPTAAGSGYLHPVSPNAGFLLAFLPRTPHIRRVSPRVQSARRWKGVIVSRTEIQGRTDGASHAQPLERHVPGGAYTIQRAPGRGPRPAVPGEERAGRSRARGQRGAVATRRGAHPAPLRRRAAMKITRSRC